MCRECRNEAEGCRSSFRSPEAGKDGGRPLDSSSMYGIIRKDAGLDFETGLVKKKGA